MIMSDGGPVPPQTVRTLRCTISRLETVAGTGHLVIVIVTVIVTVIITVIVTVIVIVIVTVIVTVILIVTVIIIIIEGVIVIGLAILFFIFVLK